MIPPVMSVKFDHLQPELWSRSVVDSVIMFVLTGLQNQMIRLPEIRLSENKVAEQFDRFELKRKFALNCPDINTQHAMWIQLHVYFQSPRIISEPEKSASINVSIEEKTNEPKSCTIGCSSQNLWLVTRLVKFAEVAEQPCSCRT